MCAVAAPFGRDMDMCLDRVAVIVAAARRRAAQLVVFPEAALGGYIYEPRAAVAASPVGPPPALERDGPELARVARMAGDVVVCIGYTEQGRDGARFSSAACVNGDGLLGHHRKVHLPRSELGVYAPGDGFAAFDTPVGRIGMVVCYDKVFPESARSLALDGATLIASLAAWPVCRTQPASWVRRDRQVCHFDLLDRARALENQVVWVSANQSGVLGRLRFPGHAKVVDPCGRVVAATKGSSGGLALARVDVQGAAQAARDEFFHLGDRRPGAYTEPAEPAAAAA